MDLKLAGKIVVITGAGSGIGQTLALAFAREGAVVAVNDVTAERVEATVAQVAAAGGRAVGVPFDVGDLDAAQRALGALEQAEGRIDVLVNNAAVLAAHVPFLETAPADWDREIRVILYGTLNCSRAVLPGMVARRAGKIVNLATDAARVGQEREVTYSAAKGGVVAFTKSIAREVGRYDINVNAVSPGATDTPLRRTLLDELVKKIGADGVREREEKVRRAYPLRRIGSAEDVSNAVLFLASDVARHITGQVLSVNGGFAMPG
jgi:2-hydroxycyclohexanecarboxyl-CoA dehydrogenase